MSKRRAADAGLAEEDGGDKKVKFFGGDHGTANRWEVAHDTLLHRTFGNPAPSAKLAMFDFDDTLVKVKSGKKWPTAPTDYEAWHPSAVVSKLKELVSDGYKLVIFTNQKGISSERDKSKRTGGPKERTILGRLEGFIDGTGLPMQVLAGIDDDQFRKPSTAGYEFFVEELNAGIEADPTTSFYCGDAAGRLAGWKSGAKADFACSDREFAFNLELPFKTPEQLFLGDAKTYEFKHEFDPKTVRFDLSLFSPTSTPLVSKTKELVIMVGYPGSGKSTFSKTHLVSQGYVRANTDELKTPAKVLAVVAAAMAKGERVVVDNTNPSKDARAPFIQLAVKHGYPVRVFRMNISREFATHLNYYRMRTTGLRRVPDIAYNVYSSKYVEPSTSEGISEIKLINFVPTFADDAEKKQFLKFT